MFSRRTLLFSLVALPVPLATAAAQPWWDERREQRAWEHERDRERRRALERHEHWDDRRAHEVWERRQRIEARREWERRHRRQP